MTKEYEQYSCLSDEELIDRQKDGDDKIVEYLCDKYKNLVRSKAKSMFILGADREDLIQEGMIGLFKAVRDFDSGRDASFYTFAELCISRQMYTAVQAADRKKHFPLNHYISLHSSACSEDEAGEEMQLINAIHIFPYIARKTTSLQTRYFWKHQKDALSRARRKPLFTRRQLRRWKR